MSQSQNRYRGVVLTPQGLQRLEKTIALAQEQEKFGSRFTQTELSERANLSIKTIKKIREGKIPTDEASVRALFSAFGLVLKTADYGQPEPNPSTPEAHSPSSNSSSDPKIDWGEKPDTALFFGRTEELATLNHWVQGDRCRLITLLGMGGIGKTSLAAKLANQVYDRFDYVIWRSLREAPPLDEILVRLIQFLSNQQETEINLPTRLGERILRLLHYLRKHRCLVVLDNLESILQAETAGHYRDGYEGYGELIQRIGSTEHQSCLLLTSRECPRELAPLAGDLTPVRLWSVGSIDTEAGREILKTKGLALDEADDQGQELIRRCSGNPQALHLVATAIQREFLGDVDDFLQEQVTAVEDVRSLLDQHLSRLAPLERSVLFWLAINREPVGLDELMEDLLPPVTKQEVRGALRGLSDRYLIETVGKQFTLQNVIMEFVTDRLVEQVYGELKSQQFDLFHTHALLKATAKDYVRETQLRLILKPIAGQIENLQNQIFEFIEIVRQNTGDWVSGYSSGNLLNMLSQTQSRIYNANFSEVTIRQAYLKGIKLHNTDFSNSFFTHPSFTQLFGVIYTLAFSPNGDILATGDGNGFIQIWNIKNQQQLAMLKGHSRGVRSVVFSPDGQFLASGGEDSIVKLWDIEKKECLYILEGHTNWVRSIAFSLNNRFLATGSSDLTIRLWDIQKKKYVSVFRGHTRSIRSVSFSHDSQFLASGSSDSTIRIWSIQKKKCTSIFRGHTKSVRSVSFSHNGQFLASGSGDNTVALWDVKKRRCIHIFEGHKKWVQSVIFSPNDHALVSVSGDCTIRIWDIPKKQNQYVLEGHTNPIRAVSFSPSGKFFATCGGDDTIRLWDFQKKQCVFALLGSTNWIRAILFSPDSLLLVSSSEDAKIRLWDANKKTSIHVFEGHSNPVRTVAFSGDGQFLASGSEDSTIRLWDMKERKCVRIFEGHENAVISVDFSPDARLLTSGSHDGTIRLWNVEYGKCIYVFDRQFNSVRSVIFSPDGKLIASGIGSEIKIWDVCNHQNIFTLTGHTDWIRSLAFNPNGNILASCSGDQSVRLWNVYQQHCIHVFEEHTDDVRSVSFSPDGQLLASCSGDGTIRLLDIQNRRCIYVFEGHSKGDFKWLESVIFSSDGLLLASSGNDGIIRLWDLQKRDLLVSIQVPRPYEGSNFTCAKGLTDAQRVSLLSLGAIDSSLKAR